MRSSFTSYSGLSLARTPSWRQQAMRRRLMLICAILALALASGVIGSLTAPRGDIASRSDASRSDVGPFSYFPHS
jgi:hypothetical protein